MNEEELNRVREIIDSEMCYVILGHLVSSDSNNSRDEILGNLDILSNIKEALNKCKFSYIDPNKILKEVEDIEGILNSDLSMFK